MYSKGALNMTLCNLEHAAQRNDVNSIQTITDMVMLNTIDLSQEQNPVDVHACDVCVCVCVRACVGARACVCKYLQYVQIVFKFRHFLTFMNMFECGQCQ